MRDPERQNIFGNKFIVKFPQVSNITRQPRYITITQKMGTHDIADLYFQSFSPALMRGLRGALVEIKWSNDKTNGVFIGHVTDVDVPTAQTMERPIKLRCVSASYPLKNKFHKIWKNVTASEVVKDIAKMYGLKAVVTDTKVRFSQLSMAGHSAWEKLRQLADKHGYGLQVLGTELHFHPVDKMIDQFMTTIPVMSFLDPYLNPQSHFSSQTLSIFNAKVGDYVETSGHNRSNKVVSGVDPYTAKVYKSKSEPNKVGKNLRKETRDSLFTNLETKTVVASEAMAETMAAGKAHLSRLAIPAKGSGQGDPRIAPWATIEVRGTGSTTDGFWIVKSAVHTIHYDGRYTVDFECATDGIDRNNASASRPSSAGTVPTVNLALINGTTPRPNPKAYKVKANTVVVKQGDLGFKTIPSRWAGV